MKVHEGYVIDSDLPDLTEDGRRAATERSMDCRYCGGNGMAIVDATRPEMRVRTCSATCVCVHGRWIRAWHMSNRGQHLMARMPDLRQVLDGKVRDWTYVSYDAEPSDEPAAPTRGQIAAMFRRPA